jgi:hypothetical protein
LLFSAFWWMLLQKRVVRTTFDIYVFIKERKITTCNHPPVKFVNTIYQCFFSLLIKSFSYVLLASLVYFLNNTILVLLNASYIYNERQRPSHNFNIYYMLFSYRTGYVIWHSQLSICWHSWLLYWMELSAVFNNISAISFWSFHFVSYLYIRK